MKEHPILFSGEMVRAILDGRKTQTRRICKPSSGQKRYVRDSWAGRVPTPSEWNGMAGTAALAVIGNGDYFYCPYGQPGDRLVMLCTWAAPKKYDKVKPSRLPKNVRIWTLFDGSGKPDWCGRPRPGRFMPKWMRSRMPRAEITEVRVQRVQDISEEGARAEGCEEDRYRSGHEPGTIETAVIAYERLWDRINGKTFPWASNPWVWAITFRRVKAAMGERDD